MGRATRIIRSSPNSYQVGTVIGSATPRMRERYAGRCSPRYVSELSTADREYRSAFVGKLGSPGRTSPGARHIRNRQSTPFRNFLLPG